MRLPNGLSSGKRKEMDKKLTIEEALVIIENSPEGFAKEFFKKHPQVFIDLIPNLEETKKEKAKIEKKKKEE